MKRWFFSATFLLCVLGVFLRGWNFWYFPVGGETQDEMAWSILGSSLLQTGQPVSWSYFSGYQKVGELRAGVDGAQFPLVAPALDHPPLFSLIPGLVLRITGVAWDVLPSLKLVRAPMVLLGSVNVLLFALWQKRRSVLQSEKHVSLLLFATLPAVVFLSRLVVAENLLVTFLILGLLLFTLREEPWRKIAWFFTLAAFPLIKVSGIAIALAFLSALWLARDEKGQRGLWKWALSGLLGGLLVWFAYAAVYDFSLFWQVQSQQAQRDTGMLTLISTQLTSMVLVEKVFADPWLILSWVSAFVWFAQKKQDASDRLISLLFLSQLAFVFVSVGEHTVHGWYRIPLWPLFCVMLARWMYEVWESRNWISLAWLWLWFSSLLRLSILHVFGNALFVWQSTVGKVWLIIAGLFTGLAFLPDLKRKTGNMLWNGVALVSLLILVLCHVGIIMSIQHQTYWEDVLYWEQGLRP